MLSLALLAGVVPSTLAGIDGDHFGVFADQTSQHSHIGDDVNSGHTDADPLVDPLVSINDHNDSLCSDHCCSDACSAALSALRPDILSLKNPLTGFISAPAELSPTEELFIPPKLA